MLSKLDISSLSREFSETGTLHTPEIKKDRSIGSRREQRFRSIRSRIVIKLLHLEIGILCQLEVLL